MEAEADWGVPVALEVGVREAGTTEGVADSEPGAGLLKAVVGLAVVVAVVVADKAAGDAVGVGSVTVPSVEMARSTQLVGSRRGAGDGEGEKEKGEVD